MRRYKRNYIDIGFLLKKIDKPEIVIKKYLKSKLNISHHELVDEIPSIEEIQLAEQHIIKCFAALHVFKETIEELYNASSRRIGSLALSIEMGEIYESHVRENISIYQKELEKGADKLARYSEQILFSPLKEECTLCK